MKTAEHVTFGSSGLDRAAHLRNKVDDLRSDPAARAIVFWRGKVLVTDEDRAALRVPLDHPVFADVGQVALFLGLDGKCPVFAVNLDHWSPPLPEADQMQAFLDPTEQRHPLIDGAAFCELRAIMTQLTRRDAELAATGKSVLSWHDSHQYCSNCGVESEAADAGWRRACPACQTSHFPRTDPVVIMLILSGDNVLVGRSPGWPEGMYSLLAGFVEPGETLEAAVRREVFEEAGVTVGQVTYLSSQPWAFPSSLMIGCMGHATTTAITLDPNELEDARWISRAEMARASRGEHPHIKPARQGAIAHFLLENWLNDTLD